MQINRKIGKYYLLGHLGVLLLLCCFPFYQWIMQQIPIYFKGCVLHDRLHLYCAFCGGTRALESLITLDLVSAMQYNPFVTCSVFLAIGLDSLALIRLLKGKSHLLPCSNQIWIAYSILLIVYMVVRNYLMIAHGYDPCGDLVTFWHSPK